ncbi:hypothetical protein HY486_01985 [Candidatus Woesearchaeota archaeon]|nr:hypothetical protein [Candidatus Woesearchaeota archaeon]
MKCSICNNVVEETFLGKIKGTFVRKDKKSYPVCFSCQASADFKSIFEKL